MKNFTFVAGSAHLDIISRVAHTQTVLDKNGSVTISFGGGALNMAINLATFGHNVVYMGAFKDGAISQMIISEMSAQGVRPHVVMAPNMADAAVNLFLNGDEVTNSVVSLPITQHDFEPDFIERGLKNAACAVINCTLSPATLNHVVRCANALNIPVYIAGVSENQCLKLPDIAGKISQIYLNQREFLHLCQHHTKTAQEMAKALGTTLVVTQGAEGARIYTSEEPAGTLLPAPHQNIGGTTLGAGDFLMAHTVAAQVYENKPLTEALSATLHAMPAILNTEHANLGRNNQLEMNIQDVVTKAHIDKLTQIMNRLGVENALAEGEITQEPAHVMLVDIDHFKQVNDTHGHSAGDAVLTGVAQALKRCLRYGDVLGRWGGEEFIAILRTGNTQTASLVAERMRAEVAALNFAELGHANITASFGLAPLQPEENFSTQLEQADKALYQAKETGRNRVVIAS